MLACALRSYLDDIALTAALGIRINDMQERISRFEQCAEKKRALITAVDGARRSEENCRAGFHRLGPRDAFIADGHR